MAIRHYTGKLRGSEKVSDFDYDDKEFYLRTFKGDSAKALIYRFPKGSENMDLRVSLPKGVYSTAYMFTDSCAFCCNDCGSNVCRSLSLVDFDTSEVDCMSYMFCGLTTRSLNLGSKFFTGNVRDMSYMFGDVITEKPIDLGTHFNTTNVLNMRGMFYGAVLRKGFSLGDEFYTDNVKDMSCMFYGVTLHRDFTLGDNFDTSNVTNMECMFDQHEEERTDPRDIDLVVDEEEMECVLKTLEEEDLGYYAPLLGDKFDTSRVENMFGMFANVKFPKNFTFGNKFKLPPTNDNDCYDSMLLGYEIHPDSDLSFLSNFINSGCNICRLFREVTFSEDYVFPDWFDFDNYSKEVEGFEDHVVLRYKKDHCCIPLEIFEMLLIKDAKVANDCKRDLSELLKGGKNIGQARSVLLGKGYSGIVVDYSMDEVVIQLSDRCRTDVKTLLAIKSDKYSGLTISEARDKLLAKGYPEIVVLRCICDYIGDQYLSL